MTDLIEPHLPPIGLEDEPKPLLSCPFCGGPAVNVSGIYITCGAAWNKECIGHQIKAPTDDNDCLRSKAWNTRSPSTQRQQQVGV